jgi:mannose/fructose/N-acetylgalactosamine-specific phosphotransferase system component IIB
MTIKMMRVDDRMVHGQITTAWARMANIDHIVVANDKAANDEMLSKILKMATPMGMTIDILTKENAVQKITGGIWEKDSILFITRNSVDMLEVVENGLKTDFINIGNIRKAAGMQKINREVWATPEEVTAWYKLNDMHIQLEIQWTPIEKKINFNKVLESQRKKLQK